MDLKEKLKEVLAREFNIKNDEELEQAIKEMPKLDIGIFVSPIGGMKSA